MMIISRLRPIASVITMLSLSSGSNSETDHPFLGRGVSGGPVGEVLVDAAGGEGRCGSIGDPHHYSAPTSSAPAVIAGYRSIQ
jgi:hypothetical protein